MMIKKLILSTFFLLAGFMTLQAQGITAPSDGKAVVYFTRVTSYGAAVSFEYFHNDQFIGVFKGKNYMRYEVEPGEHLFWVSSEDKEFVTADLKAGGIYIIIVNIEMGAFKARVGLTPITANDSKLFGRAKALIKKKAPKETSDEVIQKTTRKLEQKNFIPEKLKMYEEVWKKEKDFSHISPDMAIPLNKVD